MTDIPRPSTQPELLTQETPEYDEQEVNTLGMWVFLASEVLFFGALFSAYTIYRHAYPAAFAEGSQRLDLLLGSINTGILLTSSFSMALAVRSAQTGKRAWLALLLVITMFLGVAFLGIKGSEYLQKINENFFPGSPNFSFPGKDPQAVRLFFSLYFVMTGLHAIHMIVGILLIGVMALRALFKQITPQHYMPVEMLGLYWHFVDIVWIFLFPLLYLIK
jgi:cytochrome c oxidase subunit III